MTDLVPYDYQVAGHHKGHQSRVLKDGKGRILKPLKVNANPTFNPNAEVTKRDTYSEEELLPVCRDELEFYHRIAASTLPDDRTLRTLMPSFHGTLSVPGPDGHEAVHLLLGDLTWGMRHPCVADVKIGHTDFYPGKTKRKRAVLQELGFRLTGMRMVQMDDSSRVIGLSQEDSKLSTLQVLQGLDKFCCSTTCVTTHLRHSIASQLQHIHHWALSQRTYKIRGSSILIAYDADQFASVPPDVTRGETVDMVGEAWPTVTVKMIDFAHVLHSFGDIDENYISGLENLIKYISNKENDKL